MPRAILLILAVTACTSAEPAPAPAHGSGGECATCVQDDDCQAGFACDRKGYADPAGKPVYAWYCKDQAHFGRASCPIECANQGGEFCQTK